MICGESTYQFGWVGADEWELGIFTIRSQYGNIGGEDRQPTPALLCNHTVLATEMQSKSEGRNFRVDLCKSV